MVRRDMDKFLIQDLKLRLHRMLLTEFGKDKVNGITENELEILNLITKDKDIQDILENNK